MCQDSEDGRACVEMTVADAIGDLEDIPLSVPLICVAAVVQIALNFVLYTTIGSPHFLLTLALNSDFCFYSATCNFIDTTFWEAKGDSNPMQYLP